MSTSRLTLVTGAAGKTGRKVVAALADKGSSIRAFVHRPETKDDLAALGAEEIVSGDLFGGENLEAAIKGCDQVLHICPPMNPQEAELAKQVTDLCKKHNVSRLILWSVLHPLLMDVRHHRLKLEAEHYLVESGLAYTILQPSRYMQHLMPIWRAVMETGIHAMPFSTDVKFSLADLDDLAEAAAIVTTSPGHEGATYQLAGPEQLSQTDMAAIIADIIGKDIRAKVKPEDQFREIAKAAGLPQQRIDQICAMNAHYDSHGLIGNGNILRYLLGREPTDFKTFVKRDLVNT